MAPFVARLYRRGLIERRRVDGRSQALALTAAGRSLLAESRAVVDAYERALLRRVPRELRPMVVPILMALWKGTAP